MEIVIAILLGIIIIILLQINSKLPNKDYVEEALKRDKERREKENKKAEN